MLIYGESGTGKELVARAIHVASERRDRPFVAVNVGGAAREHPRGRAVRLREGRLHRRRRAQVGLFEQASGSTLFLDEIGELKRDLQVKLLRVLQEREILRVGRHRAGPRSTCAWWRRRTATSSARCSEGRFREDLFYRLNVIPIQLPPLRERRTDVPLLVEHFLAKHAEPGRHAPDRSWTRSRRSSPTPGPATCASSSRSSSARCCSRTAT